jgi:hypothetical protein
MPTKNNTVMSDENYMTIINYAWKNIPEKYMYALELTMINTVVSL